MPFPPPGAAATGTLVLAWAFAFTGGVAAAGVVGAPALGELVAVAELAGLGAGIAAGCDGAAAAALRDLADGVALASALSADFSAALSFFSIAVVSAAPVALCFLDFLAFLVAVGVSSDFCCAKRFGAPASVSANPTVPIESSALNQIFIMYLRPPFNSEFRRLRQHQNQRFVPTIRPKGATAAILSRIPPDRRTTINK